MESMHQKRLIHRDLKVNLIIFSHQISYSPKTDFLNYQILVPVMPLTNFSLLKSLSKSNPSNQWQKAKNNKNHQNLLNKIKHRQEPVKDVTLLLELPGKFWLITVIWLLNCLTKISADLNRIFGLLDVSFMRCCIKNHHSLTKVKEWFGQKF